MAVVALSAMVVRVRGRDVDRYILGKGIQEPVLNGKKGIINKEEVIIKNKTE